MNSPPCECGYRFATWHDVNDTGGRLYCCERCWRASAEYHESQDRRLREEFALRELLTFRCPGCGQPVVGWTASRAHCALPTNDDAAEWQEYERRRHEEPR